MSEILSTPVAMEQLIGSTVNSAMIEIHKYLEEISEISIFILIDEGVFNFRCKGNGNGICVYFEADRVFEAQNISEIGEIYFERIDKLTHALILNVSFDLNENVFILLDIGLMIILNEGDQIKFDMRFSI